MLPPYPSRNSRVESEPEVLHACRRDYEMWRADEAGELSKPASCRVVELSSCRAVEAGRLWSNSITWPPQRPPSTATAAYRYACISQSPFLAPLSLPVLTNT